MNEKKNSKIPSHIPVATMIEGIIGCKWSLQIMDLVRRDIRRPGEMQRLTPGLSHKVLNERLNKLMRFRIIEKKIYPVTPPHVEYRLTAFGKKFSALLAQIEVLEKEIEKDIEPQANR